MTATHEAVGSSEAEDVDAGSGDVGAPHADRWFAVPLYVWVACATLGALLFLSTALVPFYANVDELSHHDMVLVAGDIDQLLEDGWPYPEHREVDPALRAVIADASRLSRQVPPRDERPTLEQIGDRARAGEIPVSDEEKRSRMAAHPPLYYLLDAGVSAVTRQFLGGRVAYDEHLWSFRVVNILMMLPIPLLAYLLARQFTRDRGALAAAAVFPLIVPGLVLRNAANTQNDNLVMLVGAIAVLVLIRVVDGDFSLRTAATLGALAAAMLLTKAHGIFLCAAIAVTYVWAYAIHRGTVRFTTAAASAFTSGAVAVVFGGWWWVKNYLQVGVVRPRGMHRPIKPIDPDWGHWAAYVPFHNWTTFWGGGHTGLFEMKYAYLLLPAVGVTLVGLVYALVRSPQRRRVIVALLYPVGAFITLVAFSAKHYPVRAGHIGGIHGRYLYGGFTAVMSVAAAGLAGLSGRRSWLLPPAVLVLGGGLVGFAFFRMVRDYYLAAEGGVAAHIDAVAAWSPVPPVTLWVAAAVVVVGWITMLVLTSRPQAVGD